MTTENTLTAGEVRHVAAVDLFATALSALCLVHCLALPLLMSALAVSLPFAENEAIHKVLVLLAAPATIWVMRQSRSMANQRAFRAVAGLALALLFASAFLEPLESVEEPVTIAGALLLGSAHLWHWLHTRALRRANDEPARVPGG